MLIKSAYSRKWMKTRTNGASCHVAFIQKAHSSSHRSAQTRSKAECKRARIAPFVMLKYKAVHLCSCSFDQTESSFMKSFVRDEMRISIDKFLTRKYAVHKLAQKIILSFLFIFRRRSNQEKSKYAPDIFRVIFTRSCINAKENWFGKVLELKPCVARKYLIIGRQCLIGSR